MFDLKHPFFAPMWRRVVVVVVCFGWGLFEFSLGQTIWGIVFCAAGALCVHQFFIAWKTPPEA